MLDDGAWEIDDTESLVKVGMPAAELSLKDVDEVEVEDE